jgi:FKBP-type peptidyl-prolyl cis-trans isomerase FklB
MMAYDRQRRTKMLRGLLAACALALCVTPVAAAAADTSEYPVVLPALKYKVLASGPAGGTYPTRKDNVRVVYEAGLADGKVVDKSPAEGVTFPLGKLIPAWQVIVPMMQPGDEWQVYAPFQFAYGVTGKGDIPPSTDMVFKIKLLGIAPAEPEAPAK